MFARLTAGNRESLCATRFDGFELINIKLLVNNPNLEIDIVGGRQIDLDFINIEPEEEPLDLNTMEIRDGTHLKLAGDLAFVVDQVIEVDVTRVLELDDEAAVVGERVGRDGVGEKATGKAVFGEDFPDGWLGVGAEIGECR